LIRAQKKVGLSAEAVTGPLHQLDEVGATNSTIDEVSYWRTPLYSGVGHYVLNRRIPFLREMAVVRLLRERILELLDSGSFDLVHAHSPALCGLAALQAATARSIPFIYEIRAFWEDAAVDQKKTGPQSLRYRISRGLEEHVAGRADAVVGIARHIVEDLHLRGLEPDKLFHVPNGVDADRFTSRPRDTELAAQLGLSSVPVLGFIGSLYRYEGIAWLVHTASELRRRGTQFQILVVGQGEDMPEIQAAIRETQAEGYVHAIGQVPHAEASRYYSLMDVMVYPRRRNRLTEITTPLKPLEAMAQGKAVLASDVGGIRELIEPEEPCFLFQPEDVNEFCSKASQLLGCDEMRRELGERARVMVSQKKDWRVLAQRYHAVYTFARSRYQSSR
jgi:PEP-CTERM/exosortase A-associated glycosyltransferase